MIANRIAMCAIELVHYWSFNSTCILLMNFSSSAVNGNTTANMKRYSVPMSFSTARRSILQFPIIELVRRDMESRHGGHFLFSSPSFNGTPVIIMSLYLRRTVTVSLALDERLRDRNLYCWRMWETSLEEEQRDGRERERRGPILEAEIGHVPAACGLPDDEEEWSRHLQSVRDRKVELCQFCPSPRLISSRPGARAVSRHIDAGLRI